MTVKQSTSWHRHDNNDICKNIENVFKSLVIIIETLYVVIYIVMWSQF